MTGAKKRRYRVSLQGPEYDFGALTPAFAGTSWGTAVTAEDREDAITQARAECAETFSDKYAEGQATVVELYDFDVTVRGRKDKRRHATYTVTAADEQDAVACLRYNRSVCKFAGHHLGLARSVKRDGQFVEARDDRVVKVRRRDS